MRFGCHQGEPLLEQMLEHILGEGMEYNSPVDSR